MLVDKAKILEKQQIGFWVLEFEDGKAPRLHGDDVLYSLMGMEKDETPEEAYESWKRGTDDVSSKIMLDATDQMIAGEHVEIQYVWNHPDGSRRTVRCIGSRDFNCSGFIRISGTHRDLSSFVHFDEDSYNRDRNIIARYLETAKYAVIVNLAKDSFNTIKHNPDNDSVVRIGDSGCYSDMMRTYTSNFVSAPNVRSLMEMADPSTLRSKVEGNDSLTIRYQKKMEGRYLWYEISAHKLSADEVFVTFHDVDRLVQKQLFWEAVSTQMICGFIIDLKSNTVTFTKRSSHFPAFANVDYVSVERLINIASTLMDEEYKDDWKKFCDIENLRSISRESRRADFSFTTHVTGTLMWIKGILYPFAVKEGGVTLALSFYQYTRESLEKMKRDEEYRSALEAMHFAQEANRLKTTFVQNISHDIRTPLNAIVGFSSLLSMPDGFLSELEKRQYADYIRDSTDLLTMIVDDVLCMSDMEKGILNIRMQKSFCNEMCRKSVNCSTMRTPSGVKMYYTSDVDDDFSVQTDPMRVRQVLVNFLSNACKHTTQGEIHVHCSVSENPGMVTFSVTDTGEGIPEDIADDIFERFTTMDAKQGGHGMGLNICREMSERLGGYVRHDRSYKNGARFILVIPV